MVLMPPLDELRIVGVRVTGDFRLTHDVRRRRSVDDLFQLDATQALLDATIAVGDTAIDVSSRDMPLYLSHGILPCAA